MAIKRTFLFLSLILLCVAAFSIHLNRIDAPVKVPSAVIPFLYTALALLVAGGCLHSRFRASAKAPGGKADARSLTPRERLLLREIYLEKLAVLQGQAKGVEGEIRTPHGRHFINELGRIIDTMQKSYRTIQGKMEASEAARLKAIQVSEAVIARAREELKEAKRLLKQKAMDRKDYKTFLAEKESTIKKCRLQISRARAMERRSKKIRLTKRLGFKRRALFLSYLNKSFVEKPVSAVKVVQGGGLFHPKIAKEDLKKQKIANQKRTVVETRIIKLEERREKITALDFREKMKTLLNEKKVRDKALTDTMNQISSRIDLCKSKKDRIEDAIQTLIDELEDMKTLSGIKNLFPSLVRMQQAKIHQAIKFGRKALPDLQRIESIYNEAPTECPEPA